MHLLSQCKEQGVLCELQTLTRNSLLIVQISHLKKDLGTMI